jgi:tRNA A22 N-methylase
VRWISLESLATHNVCCADLVDCVAMHAYLPRSLVIHQQVSHTMQQQEDSWSGSATHVRKVA